jgi:fermentation-respiration switch protein FrsA (DUF1100 family)
MSLAAMMWVGNDIEQGDIQHMEIRQITFTSEGLKLSGNLYLPAGGRKRPAIVLTTAISAVKEQIAANYAQRLATAGFVALAFDHRNFGESEGTPRQHEDPQGKLADLRDAVSYLRSLPEVDAERIGACGVCLGTGYALHLAAFDPRIKALVLIAGSYLNAPTLQQRMGKEAYHDLLVNWASIEERQYHSGKMEYIPAVTSDGKGAGMPAAEAYEYYGTARGQRPRWINWLSALSVKVMLTFDYRGAAHVLSQTPVLIVHGRTDLFCIPEDATWLYEQVSEPKEILWLPTRNHIDLYDVDDYVNPAAQRAAAWFEQYLH